MNRLLIPPASNWYEPNLIACTPDNTFIYASRRDVVVINPGPPNESADIKLIRKCHHDRTNGVGFSPNWGKPDKLALSYGDDKVVCLLDLTSFSIKKAHSGHTTHAEKLVGATFCGHDRIVSVSEDGFIIVWKWAGDQLVALEDLLGSKTKVSCISSCPHVSWLTAIGLKRGDILIVDLRKTGRILHRLRGHDNSVTSLSWCPTPCNIFLTNAKSEKESKQKGVSKNDSNEVNREMPEETHEINEHTVTDNGEEIKNIAGDGDGPFLTKIKKLEDNSLNGCNIKEEQPLVAHKEEANISRSLEKYENIENIQEDNYESRSDKESIKKEDLEIRDITEQKVTDDANLTKYGNDTKVVDQNEEVVKEEDSSNIKKHFLPTHEEKDCLKNYENNENIQEEGNSESKLEKEDINSLEIVDITEQKEIDEHLDEDKSLEQNQEVPTKEFLLASAARGGKSIIIWRAGTSGVIQTELHLSHKPRNKRGKAMEKPWITLCWATPTGVLSSSPKGELIQWNLSLQKDNGSYKWRLVHSDHWKQLFGIAVPLKLYQFWEEKNWKDDDVHVWTIGKDRYIYNTSLGVKRNTVAAYPTFAGSIFCLASSVYFPSQIAIGSGDGSCRLWDLSRPHTQYLVMKQCFDKLQSCKVVCVAWNPQKENILAYGTADGRVALIDPCNCYKQPAYLVQHGNNAIHRLSWGPLKEKHEYMGLYVVNSGKLLIYDIHLPLAEPVMFDKCQSVSDIAWKPDWALCAIANKDGHVMLFSKQFELITTLYMQNKAVRWLAWHPPAAAEEEGVSSNSSWLAVASTNIVVYNCTADNNESKDVSEQVVAVFNDHETTVECLSWSTFEKGKLASVDGNGVALVWDVNSKKLLHTCMPLYDDSFMSILWSPVDPGYIITGSRNNSIQIWKLSDHPPEQPKAKKHRHKTLKLSVPEPEEPEEEEAELEKQIKKPRKFVLPNLVQLHTRTSQSNLIKDCKRLYAHFFNKPEFNETCNGCIDDKQVDLLKLFGDEQSVNAVLELEKNCRHRRKLPQHAAHISLWQGDVSSSIKEAIDTKTLDSWLVSMAPAVSHRLYLEACEAYADQLSEEGSQAYESASYYLVCHKFDNAIEVLCSSHNYTEALVLAKCHLLPTDPLITSIIERWAKYSTSIGCFEVAAQCYIMLKQPEEAAKALFKRQDVESLAFAAQLATHSENVDLINAVLFRLNTFKNTEVAEENGDDISKNSTTVDITENIEQINEEDHNNVNISENIEEVKEEFQSTNMNDNKSSEISNNVHVSENTEDLILNANKEALGNNMVGDTLLLDSKSINISESKDD